MHSNTEPEPEDPEEKDDGTCDVEVPDAGIIERMWMARQLVGDFGILGISATVNGNSVDLEPAEMVPPGIAAATAMCLSEVIFLIQAMRN